MVVAVQSNVSDVILMSNMFLYTAEKKMPLSQGSLLLQTRMNVSGLGKFSGLKVVVVDSLRNIAVTSLPEKTKQDNSAAARSLSSQTRL